MTDFLIRHGVDEHSDPAGRVAAYLRLWVRRHELAMGDDSLLAQTVIEMVDEKLDGMLRGAAMLRLERDLVDKAQRAWCRENGCDWLLVVRS